MKIGIVSKFGEQDGIAIYSDSLAASIRERNVEVVTIGSKRSKSDHRINLKSIFLRSELGRIAKKENLDLLHIQYIAERSYYGMHTLNLNLLDALRQRIPVAVTMHEVHITPKGIKQRIIKKLEEAVVRKAGPVIVHTKGQADFIKAAYGKDAHVIPMGVSLKRMHVKRGKNLLFFGMISKAKGVEYLLESMRLLEGFRLTVAGKIVDGDFRRLIIRPGYGDTSIETGWVSEERKAQLFTDSDILVLPYIKAPYQSAVLHDAVSYGLPTVATGKGPITEVVEEYEMGMTAEPANPEALAQAIMDVEKKYEHFQKGIQNYRKEANWERVAEKHIAAFRGAGA